MEHINSHIVPNNGKHKTKEQWLEEGTAHYKEQRYKEALETCECAIQIDPAYARAYHGKGLIFTQTKEYEEAKEAYKLAHTLAPNDAKINFDMGELFYILEEYKKSRFYYKKAIQLNSKYEKIYFDRAHALLAKAYQWEYQKYYEEAIKVYKIVLLFNPDDSHVRSILATLETRLTPTSSKTFLKQNLSYAIHPFNCRCAKCIEY